MELFERVTAVYSLSKMTQAKLAEALGASPSKFNQWLNTKSQKNLWEHLPKILEMFPDVRREWLWWGEGEMLTTNSAPTATSQQPAVQSDEVTRLLAELEEERRLNRQLVTRLLVDGVGDKDDSKNTVGKVADGQ